MGNAGRERRVEKVTQSVRSRVAVTHHDPVQPYFAMFFIINILQVPSLRSWQWWRLLTL